MVISSMLNDIIRILYARLKDIRNAGCIITMYAIVLGAIALLIVVDQQDTVAHFLTQRIGQIDRGCGLTDAALQVNN